MTQDLETLLKRLITNLQQEAILVRAQGGDPDPFILALAQQAFDTHMVNKEMEAERT